MPPSRRTLRRRTKPSQGLQDERLGEQTNKLEEQWIVRFRELLDYRSEHGSCDVPRRQGQLGRWVRRQRNAYVAGSLTQDRIDRLDGIGFKWSLRELAPTVPWETRFDELVQYKEKHGDCNVPRNQGQLGAWVHNQRSAYSANSLAQDRIDRLEGIGFKWKLKDSYVPWETPL
ncbi:hypothetical protein THAOC_04929 [Thalassiosira oceanica]|uniref:Helicase-associated domain-containing protein n=1 Tax=Thalassiosira oceanica TaxID=159749 RepID=K0TI35_THAOC|nr:hypothetical protein THAOC_04929 [Thalassiosira oceanica]|eukprot:EJK73446.1 hypothetical protein THAOC_04929 [Thalassiosira oceanica]